MALPIFLTRGFKQNCSPATHDKPPRADRRELVSFSRFRQKLFLISRIQVGSVIPPGKQAYVLQTRWKRSHFVPKKNYCTFWIGEKVKHPSKGAGKFPFWEMFGKPCPLVQSVLHPRQKKKNPCLRGDLWPSGQSHLWLWWISNTSRHGLAWPEAGKSAQASFQFGDRILKSGF